MLEGSKAFANEVMAAAGVPTAQSRTCTTDAEVLDALQAFGAPYVVKEDGLAAGKGVVVTFDRDQAVDHARDCLARAPHVVIEEYLDGPEVSLFCLSDGSTVVALEPAQDFKRVGDDNTGPNTGGMGAYSPLPWMPGRPGRGRAGPGRLADGRGDAAAGDAVLGRAVRRAGADRVRAQGDRVQRAVRRPGDPGRPGPAADAPGRSADGGVDRAAGRVPAAELERPTRRSWSSSLRTATRPARGSATRSGGWRRPRRCRECGCCTPAPRWTASSWSRPAGGCCPSWGPGPIWRRARRAAYTGVAEVHLAGGHHRSDIAREAAR